MKRLCIVRNKMIREMSPKEQFSLYFKVEYDKDRSSDGRQFLNVATLLK